MKRLFWIVLFLFVKKTSLYAFKSEINIFGITGHIVHSKSHYDLQLFTPKMVYNPGVGGNVYFFENYYFTGNFLINCWKKPFYSLGINKRNLFKIKNRLYFRNDMGIEYVITDYHKKFIKFVPFLSFGLKYNNFSFNFVYVPKKISVNEKDEFIFAYISYQLN